MKFNEDQVDKIIKLYLEHNNLIDIGHMFNCSRATISRILHRHNINITNISYKIRKLPINDIIDLYVKEEMSMYNIGKLFNCSCNPIEKILKNNNIRIRSRGETFIGRQKNYKTQNSYTKGNYIKPWNKNLTKETDSRLMEVSKKVSKTLKGHTPWNKGMVDEFQPIRNIIRSIQQFKDWRYAVYKKYNNTCMNCGTKNHENGKTIHAHHRIPLMKIIRGYNITTYEEALNCKVLWDVRNGIVLCEDCHKEVHRGGDAT